MNFEDKPFKLIADIYRTKKVSGIDTVITSNTIAIPQNYGFNFLSEMLF